jgi:hypothetical protein
MKLCFRNFQIVSLNHKYSFNLNSGHKNEVKKMEKKIIGLFAIITLALAGITGVMAYRGDFSVKGPNYNEEIHEQLETAIENNNYGEWIRIREENNLPTNGRIFQILNQDNFHKFVQLHEANQNGDTETVNEIRTELGLGQGRMNRGSDGGQGQGSGQGQNSGMKGQYFIDADNDGNCDNIGKQMGRMNK